MEVTRKKGILKYIIIFSIIVMVALTIGYFVLNKDANIQYEIEEITTFKYFKLYINGKYGVIDEKGNILIEAKYDNIDIPNPSKDVFFVYSNYDSQKGEYDTQVINSKNEKILTEYKEILPIQLNGSNEEVPYEKSVLVYKEDDKYGLINFEGKKITNAKYDEIKSLLYKEGCLVVKLNDKIGVITITGKEIVSPKYDSVSADGYYDKKTKYQKAGFIVGIKKEEGFRYGYISNDSSVILDVEFNSIRRITDIESNIYLIVTKNGEQGVYKNKELLIKHGYYHIEYDNNSDLFIVDKNNKYGVINKNGIEILKMEYDYILISKNKINAQKDDTLYLFDINGNKQDLENKTVIATENSNLYITIDEAGKYGVIDSKYSQILENKYQYIEHAFDNFFIVTEDEKAGVISTTGEIKIELEYNIIQKIKNTEVLQAISSNGNENDFYNFNFKKVLSMQNASVNIEDEYIKISSDFKREYLDKKGKNISAKEILKDSKLFAISKNDKWGFEDKEGNIKIEPKYDMVTEFNSFGYAGILKDGKWGVINEEGTVILEPYYEIEWNNPEFINSYIKLNFGYGFYYYTNEVKSDA